MADASVLKELFVQIGFDVNNSSLRKMTESLGQAEKQVTRFSQTTEHSTLLWGKFFQQFQRAAGPQREHIDVATRLGKAYEILGLNLKGLMGLAAGGAIASTFKNLTDTFSQLYQTAQSANTSVHQLFTMDVAAKAVGWTTMANALVNVRRVLGTTGAGGLIQFFRSMGVEVQIDPRTGQPTNLGQTMTTLLAKLTAQYQQGPLGATMARRFAQIIGAPFEDIERLLMHPELQQQMAAVADDLGKALENIGVDIDAIGQKSFEVEQKWTLLDGILLGIKAKLEGPILDAAGAVLDKINAFFVQGQWKTFTMEGIDWEKIGHDAAKAFIAGFTEIELWYEAFNKILDKLRPLVQQFLRGAFIELGGAHVPGWSGYTGPTTPTEPQGSWAWGKFKEWWSGGATAPIPPKMQSGGVVPIMAHAGEVILGADAVRALGDWLRGVGSFEPLVRIANASDFAIPGVDDAGGEVAPFGRLRHGDPFGLSSRRRSTPGTGDPATALGAIEKFESGGRNIMNYIGDALHTASGFFQITNTTWRAAAQRYGITAALGYTRAMDAPRWLQEQVATSLYQNEGWSPWAPYNARLRAFLHSHPGFPGNAPSGAPLGTANTWHAGDRTVTVNAQQTFNITGDDRYAIGGAVNSAASRTNADLLRNLSAAII